MEKEQKNELAKKSESGLAIADEAMQEMFGNSTLDTGTGLSFNVVKILRESAQFDLGNDRMEKKLTGHILLKHRANQYWEKSFDERGEDDDPRPQCYSIDSIKPIGGSEMQSDLCSSCQYDKFGSGKDGRGKKCRNTMRFLFLVDGSVLPIILTAPPTSLSKKGSLQHWLNSVPNDVSAAYDALNIHTNTGGPIVDYWPAHVELSLDKQDFAGGLSASLLCVKTLDVLTPDTNPAKLQQIYRVMTDLAAVYKAEQQSYIESEVEVEQDQTEADHKETGDDVPI